MSADWNTPASLSTAYATVLTNLKDRDVDAITLQYSAPSNLPTGAIKWNRASNKFQEWDGAAFQDMIVALAGGGTGSATAAGARTNLGLGTMSTQDSTAVAITGGTISGVTMSAAVITSGTLALARGGTGASLALGASGTVLQSNGAAVVFGTDGSALINLNAGQLTSGTVAQARLGSGSGGAGTKVLYDDQTYKTIDLTAVWPVGSIYMNAAVSTNPNTLLGFGTWVAMSAGKVLVNFSAGDPDFGTLAATGGEKTHVLTTAELATHSHGITDPGHTHTITDPGHTHDFYVDLSGLTGATSWLVSNGPNVTSSTSVVSATTGITVNSNTTGITANNAGSDSAHNNLQPFIVVYMWKRTA